MMQLQEIGGLGENYVLPTWVGDWDVIGMFGRNFVREFIMGWWRQEGQHRCAAQTQELKRTAGTILSGDHTYSAVKGMGGFRAVEVDGKNKREFVGVQQKGLFSLADDRGKILTTHITDNDSLAVVCEVGVFETV
jgi:hypothetical protein